MLDLLRAGFYRYVKSRLFLCSVAVAFATGVFLDNLTDLGEAYVLVAFLIYAILLSFTVGREFDDGVIKNKIAVGHSKGRIFISELILGLSVSISVFIVCALGYSVSHPRPFETMPHELMAKVLVGFLLLNIFMAEIMIIVCFLSASKSRAVIINTLIVLLALVLAYRIGGSLDRPQYLTERKIVGGEMVEVEVGENPEYIGGGLRTFYEAVLYALPFGQALEYGEMTDIYYKYGEINIPEYTPEQVYFLDFAPIYSLILIILSGGIGYLIFRRRDIK